MNKGTGGLFTTSVHHHLPRHSRSRHAKLRRGILWSLLVIALNAVLRVLVVMYLVREKPQAPLPSHPCRAALFRPLLGCAGGDRRVADHWTSTARAQWEGHNPKPPWMPVDPAMMPSPSIAIVSLGDTRKEWARTFEGVLDATRQNKEDYARLHGYAYIDASDLISHERPTSWSKVLAVQHYLDTYDWIMWMDADTVIMDPSVRLEGFLPSRFEVVLPDMVVTRDWSNNVNAGVWMMRSSDWSRDFLSTWWAQGRTMKFDKGATKSGDNDALNTLLSSLGEAQFARHIWVAEQCTFNSYLWHARLMWTLVAKPRQVLNGIYMQGDFLVHLAGIDDKLANIVTLLKDRKLK